MPLPTQSEGTYSMLPLGEGDQEADLMVASGAAARAAVIIIHCHPNVICCIGNICCRNCDIVIGGW